ncbi:MAG: enoyl-CoA hydratase/isomerase family protein [Chloroflexi bacterium]|nr:enoyl-CoA hydratase/isomerase family protein [Chloroflexota bacterium]
MQEPSPVTLEVQAGVAIVSIDNPPANALSTATLEALTSALRQALNDPNVSVLILTGRGKLFAAGADIRELHALRDCESARAFSRRGQALCELIESSPKPVIAALNGRYVLGGGTELALACHLRIMEESTQIGSPEVQLGVMVGWGGSQRLPRLVGLGRALDLLLTGRRLGAQEALGMGLVNRVVADGQALSQAMELARELARLSAPALAATLRAVRAGYLEDATKGLGTEAALFGWLAEKEDWQEGTGAFLEKRAPRFRNR